MTNWINTPDSTCCRGAEESDISNTKTSKHWQKAAFQSTSLAAMGNSLNRRIICKNHDLDAISD